MATGFTPTFSAFDKAMMGLAMSRAKRGLGTTASNPSVGAVVADPATGEVIATGWTQPGGRPHAEAEALSRAGLRALGKTLYVTLEPCAQTGRTPTCADQVLTAGLARVVVALVDPNVIIAGRGLAQIRAAGIRVDVGLMADAAFQLTRGHILRQTMQRPLVQLKIAASRDGCVAPGDGAPVWVSGLEARARGHLMRAEADAIIVGINTIIADDPELTCRLPGLDHRSPQRIVVDSHLRTPLTARVLKGRQDNRPTLIASLLPTDDPRAEALESTGAVVLGALGEHVGQWVNLRRMFATLAARGLTRVLVEGGPTLAQTCLSDDVVDTMALFQSSDVLGAKGLPVFGAGGIAQFDDPSRWSLAERRFFGRDTFSVYHRVRD